MVQSSEASSARPCSQARCSAELPSAFTRRCSHARTHARARAHHRTSPYLVHHTGSSHPPVIAGLVAGCARKRGYHGMQKLQWH
jgi:hypothetical protein